MKTYGGHVPGEPLKELREAFAQRAMRLQWVSGFMAGIAVATVVHALFHALAS